MKCLMKNSSVKAPPAGIQTLINMTENNLSPVSIWHERWVEV
jgi:hypothetical protein